MLLSSVDKNEMKIYYNDTMIPLLKFIKFVDNHKGYQT